jgi:hypothetical protein
MTSYKTDFTDIDKPIIDKVDCSEFLLCVRKLGTHTLNMQEVNLLLERYKNNPSGKTNYLFGQLSNKDMCMTPITSFKASLKCFEVDKLFYYYNPLNEHVSVIKIDLVNKIMNEFERKIKQAVDIIEREFYKVEY